MPNPLVIPAGYAEVIFSVAFPNRFKPFSFSIGAHLGTTEGTLATNLATWFFGTGAHDFVTVLSNTYTAQQIEVIGHTAAAFAVDPTVGLATAAHLPPGCAAKLQKQTSTRGRANRGSMFLPGVLPESDVDNTGTLDGALITLLNDVGAALLSAMGTDGSEPVILHHALSSVTTPTLIADLSCHSLVHSQRRRQIPRG
jgi:hypothetical protein